MLEELLDNSKIRNASAIIGKLGIRISTPSQFNPTWLDGKIKEFANYDRIEYERLAHPNGISADLYKRIWQNFGMNVEEFSVPILRLKGRQPKKKVLLQSIHSSEWAALEAIMRFVEDWSKDKLNPEIKRDYDITVVPLLSIDKFPTSYGSMNYNSDIRLETIKQEVASADMIIEVHESPMKNQFKILFPLVYGIYGLALVGSYLRFTKNGREKSRTEVHSAMEDFRKFIISDAEIMYSNIQKSIDDTTSQLNGLKIETEESVGSYSRRKATQQGKPTYGIELYSDWGEIGEPYVLFFSGMMAYPFTELSTFINRSLRKGQIKQSRMQAAENGRKIIHAILSKGGQHA